MSSAARPARPPTCAVVVTFRPWPGVLDNIRRIRAQVDAVVVVDNSGTADARALLSSLAQEPGTEMIFHSENLGVATALNRGAVHALAGGFGWLATFDQDSRIPDGFITGLFTAGAENPRPLRVGIIAPLFRDAGLGFFYSPSRRLAGNESRDLVAVSVTATSGNLVALAAWRDVGGFRDDYFIDCVDFEFCLRLRRHGWRVLEARAVILEHAQGHWQQRKWLWKNPRFNDYGPVRRYYQARNRVRLYPRFALFDSRWVARDAWGYFCDFLKLLLFCAERGKKLRAMATGFAHGVAGRMGKWGDASES